MNRALAAPALGAPRGRLLCDFRTGADRHRERERCARRGMNSCLHVLRPAPVGGTGVQLTPACRVPPRVVPLVEPHPLVNQLLEAQTLIVGDAVAREFLLVCVSLNRRRIPSALGGGGGGDWSYVVGPTQGQDELRPRRNGWASTPAVEMPPPYLPSLRLSFQRCASRLNLSVTRGDGWVPSRVVLLLPLERTCGTPRSMHARLLAARAAHTAPTATRVDVVVPTLTHAAATRAELHAAFGNWTRGRVIWMDEPLTAWGSLVRTLRRLDCAYRQGGEHCTRPIAHEAVLQQLTERDARA